MFLDETPYPSDLSLDWVFWHSCHWYLSGEEQEHSIDSYQRARLEGSLFPYINLSPFASMGKSHLVFQGLSRNNEEYWFYTITHSPKSIILCLKKKLKNKVLHFCVLLYYHPLETTMVNFLLAQIRREEKKMSRNN